MANIFVAQFRDAAKNFYNYAKKAEQEKAENDKTFNAQTAELKNSEIQAKLSVERERYKQLINQIYTEIRSSLARGNFPRAENFSLDKAFFDESVLIDLSAKEVQLFIEKHKNNPTMLRIIKDYIHRQKSGRYSMQSRSIHLPADKLEVYQRFAQSALDLVDKIYNDPSIDENYVNAYGDEQFSTSLFETIGSGMEIADYKSYNVPTGAEQVFDNITLDLNKSSQTQYGKYAQSLKNA